MFLKDNSDEHIFGGGGQKYTDKQTQTDTDWHRQTDLETDTDTDTDRNTDGQIDIHRQTDTDRQTQTDRHKQTDIDRQTDKPPYNFLFPKKHCLTPPNRGLKNGPPIIWQKMKIILEGCAIA